MDEKQYWESLKTGNTNALETLYYQFAEMLYSYGIVLVNDPDKVKDSIHDLFLYIWQHREKLIVPDSIKAYLMVSLRRRLFDKGSKIESLTDNLEVIRESDFQSSGFDAQWIQTEEESASQQKIEKALAMLSDRQREIIYMKYYQQLEYEEIGRIMDLNYQSARNLVTRALAAMRKNMLPVVILLLIFL